MAFLFIFIGAIITIVFEWLLFYIFGFKTIRFFAVSSILNLFTNLSLNFFLVFYNNQFPYLNYFLVVLIGEIIVVILEIIVYMLFFKKEYVLIPLTISANCLSFMLGVGFYALVNLFYLIAS